MGTAGEVLAGIAAAQLAGEDFLVGLDRRRADVAGRSWPRYRGWRRRPRRAGPPVHRHAVDGGGDSAGDVAAAALAALPAQRAAALCEDVTIDLDTTDVEVYGRHKRGVAVA